MVTSEDNERVCVCVCEGIVSALNDGQCMANFRNNRELLKSVKDGCIGSLKREFESVLARRSIIECIYIYIHINAREMLVQFEFVSTRMVLFLFI